ncbi:thiol-disulfide isomerase/thioredoxin [Flavobacterium sp. HSC-32F16]|uniref:TlpA family protein disulfide reductase n=1 Tax=Flavobacterium sp. HSC-32F16 TaxID=2910964 RepID=UPI0020A588FC|nr:TlpA disulfide reductase family protein [Flavobacterium sp. HSC-32F16]MCP2025829.1 thiol-disulfide isomerase/thioredoxin [Flavobacterium sp. HSC-32F16]
MKKIICLVVLALVLVSWKQKEADYAIISGIITHKKADWKIVSKDQSVIHTLKIDAQGKFRDTLRVKEGIYFLYDGTNYAQIYIENGSVIVVNADTNDFNKTVKFSGKGSEATNYLGLKMETEGKLIGDEKSFYSQEEAVFKAKSKEIKTSLETVLDGVKGISESYKTKEKRNLNYSYLANLDNYEKYHEYFAAKPGFKVSQGFLSDLDGLSFENAEDFNFSEDYKKLIVAHYTKEGDKISKSTSISEDAALLQALGSISNANIKNSLLFSSAELGITMTTDLKTYYKSFMNASTSEANKKAITESYNKLLIVDKGQPSPKFEKYENNSGGTTSLEELKGKYVYIDVWATWCGPCMAELPFLQKLEEKYHGKNISFVSISVDKASAHDKWKKMIVDKKLGGIQLIADKDFDSQFIKNYSIMAIPRFILLDPAGNIVSSNAARPAEEDKILKLFTDLGI